MTKAAAASEPSKAAKSQRNNPHKKKIDKIFQKLHKNKIGPVVTARDAALDQLGGAASSLNTTKRVAVKSSDQPDHWTFKKRHSEMNITYTQTLHRDVSASQTHMSVSLLISFIRCLFGKESKQIGLF